MKLIGDDDDRKLAAKLGALPCPCCGSAPFVNGMCFRPMVDDDEERGLGMAIMCSNRDCRLSTMVQMGRKNWMKAVERWNRRDNAEVSNER